MRGNVSTGFGALSFVDGSAAGEAVRRKLPVSRLPPEGGEPLNLERASMLISNHFLLTRTETKTAPAQDNNTRRRQASELRGEARAVVLSGDERAREEFLSVVRRRTNVEKRATNDALSPRINICDLIECACEGSVCALKSPA